jgi:MFS family permease
LTVTAVAGLAFVVQERRHPEPIIPLQLFRTRDFLLANLIVFGVGLAMNGAGSYLPAFLQVALAASATVSGMLTTPQSLGLLASSIVGGQILSRTGRYKRLTVIGAGLIASASGLMLTLSPDTPSWQLSGFVTVLGLGAGLAIPTMSVAAQNGVPYRFLGVATSSRQFFMQIGGVLGAAIFGVVLTMTFQTQMREGLTPETRAIVSSQTLGAFDDPTLTLDRRTFTAVQAELQSLPGGEAVLADVRRAQRGAITTAIHRIFLMALGVTLGTVLLSLLLEDRPLRRASAGAEPSAAASDSARTTVRTHAAAPARESAHGGTTES